MNKNKTEWEIAQELEPIHWSENVEVISKKGYQDKIKHRADLLLSICKPYFKISSSKMSILEIGGGATPMVDFIDCKEAVSIDPLANFYLETFPFLKERNVQYDQGKMEELPYSDEKFDFIICRNAIDHVEDIEKCLSESKRVLKKDGTFYLAINTFSGLLYLYKAINKDKEHPYTFNIRSFKKTVLNSGFKLSKEIIDSEDHKHFEEMESQTWWKVVLRKLFLKFDSYHFIELILKK
jgi:SAM-dependent methyltransferase